MSLHYLYNGAISTAILLLCTVYWTFLLCLQFCFPFLLYESRFCLFSLNFASLVFYLSEKVVVNDCIQLSILNIQHESLFQQSVIQPAKTTVSPRSSPLRTFRSEERLRLSDRNSILMTLNLSGIRSEALIGQRSSYIVLAIVYE